MPVTEADLETLRSEARRRATKRNADRAIEGLPPQGFDLDRPYLHSLWDQQKGCCNLCSVEMDLTGETHVAGSANMLTASTDRVDPSEGYVKGNVALVHFVCNAFKNKLSTHLMFAIARGIVSNFEARYPGVKVEIEKKLVTRDGVYYFPYPNFSFDPEGKADVGIGGTAEAHMVANPPAAPVAQPGPSDHEPPAAEPEPQAT